MRAITSALREELVKPLMRPRILFEANFESFDLNYWTGLVSINWNAKNWSGNGFIKSISAFEQSPDIGQENISIELVGQPLSLISIIGNNSKHLNTGSVWLAMVDSNDQIIADPFMYFSGRLDTVLLNDNPETPSIVLNYSSKLADSPKASELRYNSATQQHFYPDDLGFEYMEQLEDWTGFWGKHQRKNSQKRKRRNS